MAVNFEQLFSPLAPALHEFAASHEMEIRKYHHGMPVWMITFSNDANIAALKRLRRLGNINVSYTFDGEFVVDVILPGSSFNVRSERFKLNLLLDVTEQLEAAFLKLKVG